MAQQFTGLTAARVAQNLSEVRDEIAAACRASGRSQEQVSVVAAVKYVPAEEIGVLRQAGLVHVGENRAQALIEKAAREPDLDWQFIGHIQSRKVRQIVPHVSLLHAVCTDSVLEQLGRHAPGTPILIEVNVSGEAGKGGVSPGDLGQFIDRCRTVARADVRGLMTMPPLVADPEGNRRWFAELRELAAMHVLPELSMGTTQDFGVAVEEGATMVRIGTRLYV